MMKIYFKYSYIFDIIYHVFAHMKVNNASDLYDESYIEKIASDHLANDMNKLSEYYNTNFNRLMIIQFILTKANTIDDVESILLSNNRFTKDDRQSFIIPFINILRNEDKTYNIYWNNIVKNDRYEIEIASKFNEVIHRFNKDIDIYLSFGITKNGRGILSLDKYQAVVPYPFHVNNKYDINHCFYMAFHELTHQITDSMIGTIINMDDGSHDLSERIVMRADYYWLKDKESYLKWLARLSGSDTLLTVDMFEKIWYLPNDIIEKLIRSV